ncbi:MAG: hypothetical protein HY820_37730 [Acidobacteria bacterium]|nr:hypothetical protein [Acidobacteriota bacterium]
MWQTGKSEERLLVDYLLGKLPDEKLAEVEDRAFADRAFLAALQAAEADLIDAYVRKELTGPELRKFERLFLASPQRRKKVEFAGTLARLADEAVQPAQSSSWGALFDWARGWGHPLQFAAALGMLACVIGLSWLWSENRSLHSRMANLQSRSSDLERQAHDLTGRLAEEQARANSLTAQSKLPSPPPLMASLVLLPGATRAQSNAIQLLLPAGAQVAHIEIQLEAADDYPRFRVELRTARGDEVMARGNLLRQRNAGGFAVSLDVPASALPAGQYELALKGVSNDSAKDLGFYSFTVRRQ